MNLDSEAWDPPTRRRNTPVFAVIPVKKLAEAKSRLSPLLTNNERKLFCLKMLEDVLRSVNSTRRINYTVVVGKDESVLQIAKSFDAEFLTETKTGLNQAVSEAIGWCIEKRAMSVLILPADIPLVSPKDLNRMLSLGESASMVISPSRNGKGTNALLLTPPNASPTFYGPRSFERHIGEASKRKLPLSKLMSSRIALDIDTVKDLADFVSLNAKKTSAYKLLDEMEVLNKFQSKNLLNDLSNSLLERLDN